jgi:hypothetical protein
MNPDTTHPATPALTYRADPELKAGLVREALEHQDQDRLIHGTYVRLNGTWRGCAVGCTVAGRLTQDQIIDLTDEDAETDWHALWADTTGLPEWLAHVEDNIFESLPIEDAQQWPVRLLSAIPVGVDLTAAREAWLRDLVFDTEHGALALAATALESAGAAGDAARMQGALSPDWSTNLAAAATRLREIARAAASSASDAASSARAAASSASAAASSARAAASSARAAASSARAAASSARAAASSASDAASSASDAAWQWIADRLIHHIETAAVAS